MARNLLLGFAGLLTFTAATSSGVTVYVNNVESLGLDTSRAATFPVNLFRESCPEEWPKIIQGIGSFLWTSFERDMGSGPDAVYLGQSNGGSIFPSSSSFVRGVIEAWALHQHFVIRPDEVWFEILVQLNFYMYRNADKVRHLFVNHTGKEPIEVTPQRKKHRTFGEALIEKFGEAIQESVKPDWLLDWIKPGFSTTTQRDELTATVLMMGATQHYYTFSTPIFCGLPSITLRGQRSDWVALLDRLKRLEDGSWGEEPADYAATLRPILEGIVKTWDDRDSQDTKEFWSQIVLGRNEHICGGSTKITGWISGFHYWNVDGEALVSMERRKNNYKGSGATLGDIQYIPQDIYKMAVGYAKAPIKLRGVINAYLLAGNIGIRREEVAGNVTATPLSGWFIYGPVDDSITTTRVGSKSELDIVRISLETEICID